MNSPRDLCSEITDMQRGISPWPDTFFNTRTGRCTSTYPRPAKASDLFCTVLEQQALLHEQMAEHCRETARLILNSDDF